MLFFNLLRWSIDTVICNFLNIFCNLFFDMVFKFSFVRANFLFYQFQSQISYFLDYNRETLPGGISIFLLGSSLNCTSSHWCFFKVEHSVIYIWYKYPIFFYRIIFAGFYDIFVLEMILHCWRYATNRYIFPVSIHWSPHFN